MRWLSEENHFNCSLSTHVLSFAKEKMKICFFAIISNI